MALLQKAYLGSTPLWRDVAWFERSPRKTITSGSGTATANTAAHTKGAWQQIIASTPAAGSWLHVQPASISAAATNTATLCDIAIGASGSEVAIASNIAVGGNGGYFTLPVQIPSGSRLSVRIQSVVTGGKTGFFTLWVVDAGDYALSPTSVDVIGTDTATSQGTSFTGASGTWVQATASTSRAYRAVSFVPSTHDTDIVTFSNNLAEIGVGAAGSEVDFASQRWGANASEFVAMNQPFPIDPHGRAIPAGSRLAVRHAIAANPSKYGFTLIGIP